VVERPVLSCFLGEQRFQALPVDDLLLQKELRQGVPQRTALPLGVIEELHEVPLGLVGQTKSSS
jgi:hypothetical protein